MYEDDATIVSDDAYLVKNSALPYVPKISWPKFIVCHYDAIIIPIETTFLMLKLSYRLLLTRWQRHSRYLPAAILNIIFEVNLILAFSA